MARCRDGRENSAISRDTLARQQSRQHYRRRSRAGLTLAADASYARGHEDLGRRPRILSAPISPRRIRRA